MSKCIDEEDRGFQRAMQRVLSNWKKHRPEQLRDVLPPEFSSGTLRHIRIHACRNVAPTTIECTKWSSSDARALDKAGNSRADEACARTNEYVCDKCKHPLVTSSELIERLGLTHANEEFSDRTWRRYLNDAKPMTPDQLRTVVANAFGQGWLGMWQTVGLWQQIDRLQAAQRAIRSVLSRILERKAFVDRREFNVSADEVKREFSRQQRLIDRDATRLIDERLRANNLLPETQELLAEVLADRSRSA